MSWRHLESRTPQQANLGKFPSCGKLGQRHQATKWKVPASELPRIFHCLAAVGIDECFQEKFQAAPRRTRHTSFFAYACCPYCKVRIAEFSKDHVGGMLNGLLYGLGAGGSDVSRAFMVGEVCLVPHHV